MLGRRQLCVAGTALQHLSYQLRVCYAIRLAQASHTHTCVDQAWPCPMELTVVTCRCFWWWLFGWGAAVASSALGHLLVQTLLLEALPRTQLLVPVPMLLAAVSLGHSLVPTLPLAAFGDNTSKLLLLLHKSANLR